MERGKRVKQGAEPVFLVKSARIGGLDYLHISLIALVAVLVGLAYALAYFQPGIEVRACQYGVVNSTCVTPLHNSTEALTAVGRVLAGYADFNSSLSLLSYYSYFNRTKLSYSANTSEWIAIVPYRNPFLGNETLNATFVLNGNLTLRQAFISMAAPRSQSRDGVVSFGTVALSGKVLCKYSKPLPVYFIADPYVPGFIDSIREALGLSSKLSGTVNMSYYFIASRYAESKYSGFSASETQGLVRYLACASSQRNFKAFVSNLSIGYTGNPLPNSTLREMVLGSGLNTTSFFSCLANADSTLSAQAALVSFYRVSTVPSYIVDCRYSSIPGVVESAINYTLGEAG